MKSGLIAILVAVVLDIVVGYIAHEALSLTSLSPIATNIFTMAIASVFLIVEIVVIFSSSGRANGAEVLFILPHIYKHEKAARFR